MGPRSEDRGYEQTLHTQHRMSRNPRTYESRRSLVGGVSMARLLVCWFLFTPNGPAGGSNYSCMRAARFCQVAATVFFRSALAISHIAENSHSPIRC